MTSPNLSRYSRRKWSLAVPLALVAAAASVAYGDFGPPQGSSGGGAAQTPWTSAIDAAGYALSDVGNVTIDGTTVLGDAAADTVSLGSTNLFAFGGTSSTYPAMRYGSSAGVIELLRGDGSAGSVDFVNNGGSASFGVGTGHTTVYGGAGAGDQLLLQAGGTSGWIALQDGAAADVALVGSSGLSVVGADALAIKDVGSTPSVTAGYTGLYSLNTSGRQALVLKGDVGSHSLVYGGAPAVCVVRRTNNETLSDATTDYPEFDAELLDPHAMHDNSTNPSRITIPAGMGGTYRVEFGGRIDASTPSSGDYIQVYFRVNATTTYGPFWGNYGTPQFVGTINGVAASACIPLAANDYVEVGVDSSEVGDLTLVGGATGCRFSVERLGD